MESSKQTAAVCFNAHTHVLVVWLKITLDRVYETRRARGAINRSPVTVSVRSTRTHQYDLCWIPRFHLLLIYFGFLSLISSGYWHRAACFTPNPYIAAFI